MMELRPYQTEAVDWLQEKGSGVLGIDMGLGKTAISLSALTPDHLPVLVTAPPRPVDSVWPAETEKWRPDLTCRIAKGPKRDLVLDDPADVTVIPRDQLHHVKPRQAKQFNTFIMDELSGFKSRTSRRWKAARAITKEIEHVWGLTGTPTPNGLLDLWPQMFLIDRGECLETTLGSFRSRYFTPGNQLPSGVITDWRLRPGAAARIHERVRPRMLSMGTEGRVKLPPVSTNDIMVDLPAKARTAYKQLKDDLVTTAINTSTFTAGNAATLSNRLRQLASGFLYPDADERVDPDEYTLIHTEKLTVVDELLESAQGSPILLAYAFRAELAQILARYPQARQLRTAKDIDDWNAGKIPLLVIHPASAGHGLNLQHGGHTMAWYSLPWSLEEYQQTNKRLARSGQKNPVVIHHLMTRNTVDTAVRAALRNKDSIQSALLSTLDPMGIL